MAFCTAKYIETRKISEIIENELLNESFRSMIYDIMEKIYCMK